MAGQPGRGEDRRHRVRRRGEGARRDQVGARPAARLGGSTALGRTTEARMDPCPHGVVRRGSWPALARRPAPVRRRLRQADAAGHRSASGSCGRQPGRAPLAGAAAACRGHRSRPRAAASTRFAPISTGSSTNPAFGRMQWAVLVQSLASGETLYSANASKLMMPASNMKIVTLAAAAERLGWDFTYETTLVTAAPVVNGVLDGRPRRRRQRRPDHRRPRRERDPRVRGVGRPAAGRRPHRDRRAGSWPTPARSTGRPLGAGWSWDYLAAGYAAGVSALQFNESVADVVIRPGVSAGAPAVIEVRPIESGLIVDTRVTTVGRRAARTSSSRGCRAPTGWSSRGTVPLASKRGGADGHGGPASAVLRADAARDARRRGHPRRRRRGEFEDVYPVPPTEVDARAAVAPVGAALRVRARPDEGEPEPVRGDAAAHARGQRGHGHARTRGQEPSCERCWTGGAFRAMPTSWPTAPGCRATTTSAPRCW